MVKGKKDNTDVTMYIYFPISHISMPQIPLQWPPDPAFAGITSSSPLGDDCPKKKRSNLAHLNKYIPALQKGKIPGIFQQHPAMGTCLPLHFTIPTETKLYFLKLQRKLIYNIAPL